MNGNYRSSSIQELRESRQLVVDSAEPLSCWESRQGSIKFNYPVQISNGSTTTKVVFRRQAVSNQDEAQDSKFSNTRFSNPFSQARQGQGVLVPIMRSKIKASEASFLESKTEVANGSKFLNCEGRGKRRHSDVRLESAEVEHASKLSKPLSQSIISQLATEFPTTSNKRRHKYPVKTGANGFSTSTDCMSDQELATVIVSKGIEMRRVETKGTTKKSSLSSFRTQIPSNAIKNSNGSSSKIVQEHGVQEERIKRKLKTQEKSSLTIIPSNLSKSSRSKNKPFNDSTVKQKPVPKSSSHNDRDNTLKPDDNGSSKKLKQNSIPLENETLSNVNGENLLIQNENTNQIFENIPSPKSQPVDVSYKTLKEFLDMPSLPLPEKKVEPTKPKTLYKSKFWEYVDPKIKESASRTNQDKLKSYDASAVKSFIEKQKEIRKLNELKEYQERQKEIENRKKTLLELNEKCRNLVSKGIGVKVKKNTTAVAESASCDKEFKAIDLQGLSPKSALDNFRKTRNLQNAQLSAVNGIFKTSKEGEMSGEANKRATLLLKEFETIVQRECISFFSKNECQDIKKVQVDKAVETTMSLEMQNFSDSSISSASTIKSLGETVLGLHSAAAKIQAVYKGYRVRKIMKEANILPGPRNNEFVNKSPKDVSSIRFRSEDSRQRRRMSFYRTPEKPYDSKAKMKAVPLSAPGHSTIDPIVQSYVPPPPISAFSPRVTSRPQVLSPLGIPPLRLNRSFDEPYPKDAIEKLQVAYPSPISSTRNSKTDLLQDNSILKFIAGAKNAESGGSKHHIFKVQRTSETYVMPAPSIADALVEKLRLYTKKPNQNESSKSNIKIEDGTRTVWSDVPYESDFESVSSITKFSEKGNDAVSHDASITDDYFGPSDSEVRKSSTPKLKSRSPSRRSKSKKHSRSKSPRLDSSVESTTTVDTDAELLKTADSCKIKNSSVTNGSTNASSNTRLTSSVSTPTVNLYNLPIPALNMRFQAEKERLNILDKALQATVKHEKGRNAGVMQKEEMLEMAKAAVDEQIKAKFRDLERDRPDTGNTQLAMMQMQCQEQATKSYCELTKWMVELSKSKEELNQIVRPDPVDLAVIVYAAVDEAKRINEKRRKTRQHNRQKNTAASNDRAHLGVTTQQNQCVQRQDQKLQYPSCSERESSISSYQESFNTGSELETTDEQTLESDCRAVSTDELRENNFDEKADAIISEKISVTKTVLEIDVSRPIPNHAIEIESHTNEILETSPVPFGDGFQLDEPIEIPDELSMAAESLNSSTKNVDDSYEKSNELIKTEIPEEMSESNKSVKKSLTDSSLYSEGCIENKNDSIEAESPRTDTVQDELDSCYDLERPQSSSEETLDTVSEEETSEVNTKEEDKLILSSSIFEDVVDHKMGSAFPVELVEVLDKPKTVEISITLPATKSKAAIPIVKNNIDIEEPSLSVTENQLKQVTETEVPDDQSLLEKIENENSDSKSVNTPSEPEQNSNGTDTSKIEEEMIERGTKTKLDEFTQEIPINIPDKIKSTEILSDTDIQLSSEEKIDLEGIRKSIHELSLLHKDDREVSNDTETEIPDELSMLADSESFESYSKYTNCSGEQKIEVHQSEISESNIIVNKGLDDSVHYSEDFIDDMSESIETQSTSELIRESGSKEVSKRSEGSEKIFDIQKPSKTEIVLSDLENETAFQCHTDAAQAQKPSPSLLQTVQTPNLCEEDPEIPHELSVSTESENLDFNGDIINVNAKQVDETLASNEYGSHVTLEKAFIEATPNLKSESFKENFDSIQSTEIHEDDSTEKNIHQESIADEDAKADHIVVDIEDNDALQLKAAKILEERQRVENEIRELEALQNPITDYLNALELREKPPPPYSPPSSESFSYSSRSFFLSLQEDKLRTTVESHVDRMWDSWVSKGAFPSVEEPEEAEVETADEDEDDNKEKGQFVAQWANASFDLLLSEVIDEVIRSILDIYNSPTALVDQVRRGPMAVKARKIRIPKTKEALVTAVYNLAVENIPNLFLPEDSKNLAMRKGPVKWACRPRDLVDDMLVEEMLEDEHLWTELWPEELLVIEELTEKIIRDSIRDVIRNCEIALHG